MDTPNLGQSNFLGSSLGTSGSGADSSLRVRSTGGGASDRLRSPRPSIFDKMRGDDKGGGRTDLEGILKNREQELDRSEQLGKIMHEKQMSIVHKQSEHIEKLMQGMAVLREEVRALKQDHEDELMKTQGGHHTLAERVQYLEKEIGDSLDKHGSKAQEIEQVVADLRGKLSNQQDLHGDFKSTHATMEQRMTYIEKCLNDSADKHDANIKEIEAASKKMQDLQGMAQERTTHSTSMEERINFLEKMMGDSADKHSKNLTDHSDKLQGTNAKVEEAYGHIMDFHGQMKNSKDAFEDHKTGVEQRLQYVEKLLGDSAEKHAQHNSMTDKLHAALQDLNGDKRDKDAAHATVGQRLDYMEKIMGDSADKHSEIEVAHKMMADNHGRTKTELDGAHKKVEDLFNRLQEHATVPQRISYIEKMLGDSSDKHSKAERDLQDANQKVNEMNGKHLDLHSKHELEMKKRDSYHATLQQRVDYLEKCAGDSADKHRDTEARHKELLGKHDDRNSDLDRRFKEVQKGIEDSHGKHEKHVQEAARIGNQLADLHGKHMEAQMENARHKKNVEGAHATMGQRVEYIEKMLGDSADKHKAHEDKQGKNKSDVDSAHQKIQELTTRLQDHSSVPQRIQYLEKLVGDSADKHNQHKQEVNGLLKDLHQKVSEHQSFSQIEKKTRDGAHAGVEERLKYVEKVMGDSADKHRELQKMHQMLHDSHKQSAGDLDNAHKKMLDVHATLQQRVNYLEKLVGDSADKHEKHVQDLEMLHRHLQDHSNKVMEIHGNLEGDKKCREAIHATIDQRVQFLEKAMGDSADKHKEMFAMHQDLADRHNSHKNDTELAGKKLSDAHGTVLELVSVPQRISYLEKIIGDSADQHDKHKSEFMKLTATLQDQRGKHDEIGSKQDQHHANVQARLDFLEKAFGDSADKHRDMESHKIDAESHRQRLDNFHSSMQQRVDYLEKQLGDSSDRHAQEIAAASSSLKILNDKHAAMAHHATFEQRLAYLEDFVGDSKDKHEKHMEEIQEAHKKLTDMNSSHSSHKQKGEEYHASVAKRIDYLEQFMGDTADKHAREIDESKKRLQDLNGAHGEHVDSLHKRHQSTETRMKFLEDIVGDSAEKYLSKAELEQHKVQNQEHKMTMENRLEVLEQLMAMVDKKLFSGSDTNELDEIDRATRQQAEISRQLDAISQPIEIDTPSRTPLDRSGARTPSTNPYSIRVSQAPLGSSMGSSGYPGLAGFGSSTPGSL